MGAVELAVKQQEHAALLRKAEAVAAEARRLEQDGAAVEEHVRAFERSLRMKQGRMEQQDFRLIREAAALRSQCEHLRQILREEQRNAMGADQCAMLQSRCSDEAENVSQELHRTLGVLRGLVVSLRSRGRVVWSPEVPQDFLDTTLHAHLRRCGPSSRGVVSGTLPPLVWRIAHGQYVIGGDRVQLHESRGELWVHVPHDELQPHEEDMPFHDFLNWQAHRAIGARGVRSM